MTRRSALIALAASALLAGCGTGETEDNVVDAVPEDARAYVHLDAQSGDWDRAFEALEKLPALETLLGAVVPAVEDFREADEESGLAYLRPRGGSVRLTPDAESVDPSLGDTRLYADLLRGLPEQRFVHGYLGRAAVGPLRAFDRTITAAAAGADVDDDLMRLRLRAAHEGEPGPCSMGGGDSDLLDLADPDTAIYLEVPSIACAIRGVAARTDGGGAALERFGRAAQRRGGVSLADELLPLLERRGALVATPGRRAPVITLIVDDVDETEALDVLARLQPALIHLLSPEELGQAPTFGAADVRGITAATAQLAPGLELSYAAWDERLVVSTSLEGIRQIRQAEGLPGSDAFDFVLGDRPDEPSALGFVDLDQLLALGEQAGLAEDPRYLAVRDDLQKLRAAGAAVSREENFTTAELTFQIP